MSKRTSTRIYSHIIKYTGLFGGVQMLNILVGLVRNKCVAVLLGPSGMGLISLFNTTVNFISNSTNFGLSMSAVRTLSEEFGKGDERALAHAVSVVRLWSFAAALLGMFACLVLSPFLSWFTFSWNGHLLHFLLLSPVVGLTAITGGELAILKAMRRLRNLASISVINAVVSLVISIPIFYFFRVSGIVPVLVLLALSQAVVTIAYSYRVSPLQWHVTHGMWQEGYGMVKLGVAFVVAGVCGSGADFLIRSYINNVTDSDELGMYNAGFMLSMTYVNLVFSAMETDYFPRLSSINHLGVTFRTTVSRQVEVMLLIVGPLLVAFMVCLPVLIPLLFSERFLPVIDMVRIVLLAMYFRAVKVPVQYIPLAKGDSKSYMLLEVLFDVAMVFGVVVGFSLGGLKGSGFGLFMASLADLFFTFIYARWRYGYRPSAKAVVGFAVQFPLGLMAYFATSMLHGAPYIVVGALLTIISAAYSLKALKIKQ